MGAGDVQGIAEQSRVAAESTVYHSAAAASGLHAWHVACQMVAGLTVRASTPSWASTLRSCFPWHTLHHWRPWVTIPGSCQAPVVIQGGHRSSKLWFRREAGRQSG